MLFGRATQPQRWAIDAASTTTMGHRCGCPDRPNSIYGPSLWLRPALTTKVSGRPGSRGPAEPPAVQYTPLGYTETVLIVLCDLGSALRESFFMFWDTLWALLGGFAMSGAVQAFVPGQTLHAKLGDHRPGAVARASAAGALSSSCSYAASAMARSLFAKGADFVTSMIFMFASTNLVIELGVVLVVLMGWQFAAAEYAGGIIMIALLALLG